MNDRPSPSAQPSAGVGRVSQHSDEAQLVIQTVWDLLPAKMHWPTYAGLDRHLHRNHRLDVDDILSQLSTDLVRGGRRQGGADPALEGQVSLTLLGASYCMNSEASLGVVVQAARLAAALEAESDEVAPRLQFADLKLSSSENGVLLARASGLLLYTESWVDQLVLFEGGWQLKPNRKVRRYHGVKNWNDYMAIAAESSHPAGSIIRLEKAWTVQGRHRRGSFGEVFKGVGDDGSPVAIKFIDNIPGSEREFAFTDLVDVRNVMPVLDQGVHDNRRVLVMPFAEKGSLRDLIVSGDITMEVTLDVLRDVAAALADLQARGSVVVHRDIKPQNILQLEGKWVLADFGIARYEGVETSQFTLKDNWTSPYAAPEQWRLERVTAAADVYSLGVVIYELLAGGLPFEGPSLADYRSQHLTKSAPELPEEVPRPLAGLVRDCLRKAPGSRISAAELLSNAERGFRQAKTPATGALAAIDRELTEEENRVDEAIAVAASEAIRRADLYREAVDVLSDISRQVMETVRNSAPRATIEKRDGGWFVELREAKFGISDPKAFDPTSRGMGGVMPFDIIASSVVSVHMNRGNGQNYFGRSHSLYYADLQTRDVYGWYELAFMTTGIGMSRDGHQPYSGEPDSNAAIESFAEGRGLVDLAYGPSCLRGMQEVDAFIERWLIWFVNAVKAELPRPIVLPDGPSVAWRTDQ